MADKKRILLVDDEPMWLETLAQALDNQGFEVRKANSGSEALATLGNYHPDLILSDVRMPEMNGFELLESIKRLPAVASTPVVFLSAIEDFHAQKVARDLGAVGYLPKPFDRDDVLSVLAKFLPR